MQYQYFIVLKKIVDRAISDKDLEELKKIQTFLNSKMHALKTSQFLDNYFSNEEKYFDYDSIKDILSMDLCEFVKLNKTAGMHYNAIIKGLKKLKGKNRFDTIYVYEILDTDREELLKCYQVGKKSLYDFEAFLNSFGLSFHLELNKEQIEILNKQHMR